MRFFGNYLKAINNIFLNLITLTIFLCPQFVSAEPVFRLSKTEILKGEPLTAQFEFKGGVDVKVPKNIISQSNVTAEYIGTEESVSIINMNVTRKKIVKFRIVTSKDGNLKTPDIIVEVDGKEIHSGEESFTVSKEKYVPKNNWFDFGEELFGGRLGGFTKRAFTEPEEDDLLVKFETTRNSVYLGEPIVGYYLLYYKNLVAPFMERNEGKVLNFPYFSLDSLGEVTITSKERTTISGKEYMIVPYQREVFAITPLKKGVYEIGEAEFFIEGSPTSYFSQRPIVSEKKKIIVKDFPSPKPVGFTGEVGDYSVKLIIPSKEIFTMVPHRIKLKIYGEGSGTYFRNPLEKLCDTKSKCNFDISMIGENRNRKFVKLKEGGYGFYSELEFEYSILPKEVGKLNFPEYEIHFFNPFRESYESRTIQFPGLIAKEKPPIKKEEDPKNVSYISLYISILIGISITYLLYRFRDLIPVLYTNSKEAGLHFIKNLFYDWIPERKRKKILHKLNFVLEDRDGLELDILVGQKKDTLLKNFLLHKGLNKEEAEYLSKVKSSNGNRKFTEILPDLSVETRQKILKIKGKLIQEERNER